MVVLYFSFLFLMNTEIDKMKKEKKDKTYGAKGEKSLNNLFLEAIGIGVNVAIKHMMEDVRNMKYGDVYDTHILVNNINLQKLTFELEKNQKRREEIKEELTLLDASDELLKDAIEDIKNETKEYEESKKTDRNNKLNDICNKILIAYVEDESSFDSITVMSIIDESEVSENINVVVGYVQNTLNSIDTDNTIVIHENNSDEGCRIKLKRNDVDKISEILEELKY